ncbi:MAG: AsnC family transcriptional regulator [Gammaproteobacteria bacterium]
MSRSLGRIDRQILKRLQADGRISISRIAREVHLSVTPCFARVRRLEAAGFKLIVRGIEASHLLPLG